MSAERDEHARAAAQLEASRAAIDAAREVHRQQIRDAHTDGQRATDIAAALGAKNRVTITAALDTPPTEPVAAPPLPPVVFLRGAGADSQQWRAMSEAMHRCGYITVRDRTQAWHLARGRVPVVLVDFSAALTGQVRIGRGQATMPTDGQEQSLTLLDAELITTPDADTVARTVGRHLPTVKTAPKEIVPQ